MTLIIYNLPQNILQAAAKDAILAWATKTCRLASGLCYSLAPDGQPFKMTVSFTQPKMAPKGACFLTFEYGPSIAGKKFNPKGADKQPYTFEEFESAAKKEGSMSESAIMRMWESQLKDCTREVEKTLGKKG